MNCGTSCWRQGIGQCRGGTLKSGGRSGRVKANPGARCRGKKGGNPEKTTRYLQIFTQSQVRETTLVGVYSQRCFNSFIHDRFAFTLGSASPCGSAFIGMRGLPSGESTEKHYNLYFYPLEMALQVPRASPSGTQHHSIKSADVKYHDFQ